MKIIYILILQGLVMYLGITLYFEYRLEKRYKEHEKKQNARKAEERLR